MSCNFLVSKSHNLQQPTGNLPDSCKGRQRDPVELTVAGGLLYAASSSGNQQIRVC